MFACSITTCSLSFQQVLPPVKFCCMWLECKRHFDPVSSLLQNVEHAKMGRWASKWEHPVHPWGIWLECNLPDQEKWLLRKETFKAFFFDIFTLLSSTEHLPSSHPCLLSLPWRLAQSGPWFVCPCFVCPWALWVMESWENYPLDRENESVSFRCD